MMPDVLTCIGTKPDSNRNISLALVVLVPDLVLVLISFPFLVLNLA
jgi:hypothetical protein